MPPVPTPVLPGEQAWLVTLASPPSAAAAMDAERVYVPLQSKSLVALDRQTGAIAWSAAADSALPPVAAGQLLFAAVAGGVTAFDARTGTERWHTSLDKKLVAGLSFSIGWLLGISETGDVVALRAEDGAAIWQTSIGRPGRYAPISDGSRVFVIGDDGMVVSLSLRDGSEVWHRSLPGTLSAPAVAPDRVFIGSDTNDFFALSSDSGEIRWRWRAGGDVIGSDVDAEGRVFFASLDNLLRSVNRGNGNQRWRKEIPSRPALPPQVAGKVVIVAGVAPTITSYSAENGASAGTYTAPGELQGPPLIDPLLRPYRVAMVLITRDGRAAGVYPTAMLFKEPNLGALQALPGVRLTRESPP